MWRPKLMTLPTAAEALPGRAEPLSVDPTHFVNGDNNTALPITGDCPTGLREVIVGMGCFWGAERLFWQQPGVVTTSVGYGGGETPNPTYDEVCSGGTGHTELVRVWYNPKETSLETLLEVFWQEHDPTQGMRQGNDIGTQYRSAVYVLTEGELKEVVASRDHYQQRLNVAGFSQITTELRAGVSYYLAETYHQQYLAKNPGGYCGLAGCQVNYKGKV